MKQNVVKRLDDRTHLRLRPSMYIGGINNIKAERMLFVDKKLEFAEIEFNPGLFKIIDEILANSIDEAIRTNFKFATNITMTFSKDQVIVSDDGRGLPQDLLEDGIPMGVAAVTEAKSGSNFSEDTKADASIGTNGVGSFATNVFSTEFIMDTFNGDSGLHLICKDGCETIDWQIKKSKTAHGTTIKFKPDLEYFGLKEIDSVYPMMFANMMMHQSQIFPIKFTLVNNISNIQMTDLF